jgi:ubiquitin-conjugating enzyme E2 variant
MIASAMSLHVCYSAAKIALEFVGTILVTDFVSGFFHWLEDAYGREDYPITGRWITRLNILHHHNPRYFTKNSWLQSSWDLTLAAAIVVAGAWLMGQLSWPVWVFAVLGANANQIHKWAHRTPRENGKLITWLQRLRLVQSSRHHAQHHTDPKNSHYCVITDFLNPVLDYVRLWDGFEYLVFRLLGVRRRFDASVTHHEQRHIATLRALTSRREVRSSE